MKYVINDKRYEYYSYFDTETRIYIRSGVLDNVGKDTGIDPFMVSYNTLTSGNDVLK